MLVNGCGTSIIMLPVVAVAVRHGTDAHLFGCPWCFCLFPLPSLALPKNAAACISAAILLDLHLMRFLHLLYLDALTL